MGWWAVGVVRVVRVVGGGLVGGGGRWGVVGGGGRRWGGVLRPRLDIARVRMSRPPFPLSAARLSARPPRRAHAAHARTRRTHAVCCLLLGFGGPRPPLGSINPSSLVGRLAATPERLAVGVRGAWSAELDLSSVAHKGAFQVGCHR